jgi:DNA-binding response OmpR family regulator
MSSQMVLLAEDSPADVYIVQRSLHKHLPGFELRVVEDGEKAIRLIDAMDADEALPCPSAMIVDLNLPRKNGREILQRIRQSSRTCDIPVIVLTSSDSPMDRAEAASGGATAYFCKPIELDEFMKIGQIVKDALIALGR